MTRPPRALVVAYDFPPHGAIGTMRTLRLVQRLAEENWDVKVLTSDPRGYRSGTPLDESLLARVPSATTILRAAPFRGFDTLKNFVRRPTQPRRDSGAPDRGRASAMNSRRRSAARRALDAIDTALAVPDHESGWVVPAVFQALSACRGWRPDVVYSSAPPWTGQVVARTLAAVLRRPWVADFRDPWARAPWREARSTFVKRANAVLERSVIRHADAVLFVTRGNLAEFSAFYGAAAASRFHLIPNGCDPSEFTDISPLRTADRFVLLHAGTLYGARNPLPLVHAIARAIGRGAIARERFRLRLVGPVNLDVDLPAECQRLGVSDVVEVVSRVTRRESLREMVSASALLLVQPVTTVSVPGKAYEYLAAGRPLLALAEEGETAELVRASGIGVSVQPEAGIDAIEQALLRTIEIASRPYARPSAALFDGRVHAAATVHLLTQFADRGRGPQSAVVATPSPAATVVAPEQRQ